MDSRVSGAQCFVLTWRNCPNQTTSSGRQYVCRTTGPGSALKRAIRWPRSALRVGPGIDGSRKPGAGLTNLACRLALRYGRMLSRPSLIVLRCSACHAEVAAQPTWHGCDLEYFRRMFLCVFPVAAAKPTWRSSITTFFAGVIAILTFMLGNTSLLLKMSKNGGSVGRRCAARLWLSGLLPFNVGKLRCRLASRSPYSARTTAAGLRSS